MIPSTFQRKTFRVRSMQITAENLHDISKWCNGTVVQERNIDNEIVVYLIVTTSRVNGRVEKVKAFVGDWVSCLTTANHFKVYRNQAYVEAFEPILSTEERREAVAELLEEMNGGRIGHTNLAGEFVTSEDYVKIIMEIFEGAS